MFFLTGHTAESAQRVAEALDQRYVGLEGFAAAVLAETSDPSECQPTASGADITSALMDMPGMSE